MILDVTFKTPDAVDDAIEMWGREEMADTIRQLTEQFVRYGQYVTIRFNTDTQTATVLKLRDA